MADGQRDGYAGADINEFGDFNLGFSRIRRKKNKKSRHKSSSNRKRSKHKKGKSRSGRVHTAKNGAKYIIDKKTGKAKFIKRR